MKINAGGSSKLIQQLEARQRGHGQVYFPAAFFNQMLDMLTCTTADIDFYAFLERMRSACQT